MQPIFWMADTSRRLVVLHDLTPQAAHAAWRAGLLARDHGAAVLLLHMARNADGCSRAQCALDQLAGELFARLGVRVHVRVEHGDPVNALVRARAALVVLGARRPNVLRDWVFGTPAERLIRLGGCPVLVVKKPATARYRRVLVPVDFGPGAETAVAAATALANGTRVQVFHSIAVRDEVTMRAADLPEAVIRGLRERSADRVRAKINELVGAVAGAGRSAVPAIGFGHALRMVPEKEQAMGADLVVIGKRRRGLLSDFFLGGVTQRVLARSRCDVLVLTTQGRRAHAGGRLALS